MGRLHQDGSPLVRPENADTVIEVGWRRWQTFERRRPNAGKKWDQRLEDLAKGLRDAFESDRRVVGPLMEDYRHLASTLGQVLVTSMDTPGDRT